MQKIDVNKEIEYYCDKTNKTICPFSNKKCLKLSRSEIGICSFCHKNSFQVICPNLFNKTNFLETIGTIFLNTKDFEVFKEVKINDNFMDFIIVDKNNNKNYVGVELQSLDTTGNYKWVFKEKVKPFCINWKTTRKTILSQLICKTPLFEKANKKIVLVIQDTFFDYLMLGKQKYDKEKSIHILTYSYNSECFSNPRLYSFDLTDILKIMIENPQTDINEIVNKLTNNL